MENMGICNNKEVRLKNSKGELLWTVSSGKPFIFQGEKIALVGVQNVTSYRNNIPEINTLLKDEHINLFHSGKLTVDFERQRIFLDNQEIWLTPTEYKLITFLAKNADMVVESDKILRNVWGDGYIGAENLLQKYISRLRYKIGDDTECPQYIITYSGQGYLLAMNNSPIKNTI